MKYPMGRSWSPLKFLIVIVTVAGLFGMRNVHLSENALDLLPGKALSDDLATLQKLGVINRIFISLTAEDDGTKNSLDGLQSALKESAEKIGSVLAGEDLFSEVFYRMPVNYEVKISNIISGLLPSLVDEKDLGFISERLAPESLELQLRNDFIRLNSLEGIALAAKIRKDPLDLASLVIKKFMSLKGGMKMTVSDGFFFSNDGRSCLIWAESRLPLTSSVNGAKIMAELEKAFDSGLSPGIHAGIIGALPHTLANAKTIKDDLKRLLPAAMLLLGLFLVLFLKSPRALVVVCIPFLAIPPAVTLMSCIFGTVSSLALGFGIVLLGIGVDFAVHIFLGSAANDPPGFFPRELQRTVLTAALTTISVFIILIFSDVPSHRQMAFLAIVSLSWALFLSWVIIPGIAKGYAVTTRSDKTVRVPGYFTGRMSAAGRKSALIIWLCLVLTAVYCAPGLHYNGDMKTLDAPSEKVKEDEKRFISTWGHGQEQAFIIATGNSWEEALDRNDLVYHEIRENHDFTGVQSIAPIVPGPLRQKQNIRRWSTFWQENLAGFSAVLVKASLGAGFTEDAFQPFLESLQKSNVPFEPEVMTKGPLRPLMRSLISEDSAGGGVNYFVATILPDNQNNRPLLEDIAINGKGVTVISNSRWRTEVERLLNLDIIRLSLSAAVVVFLICAFFFRNIRQVFAVLAPVVAALAAMVVFSRVTGGELNIMHVLMGIMVIGISVDYGIFVVRSFQTTLPATSFKAVTICAVSTLSGFGVLAMASHPALQSLGLTVLVGIGTSWPVALLVTPAILKKVRSGQ